MAEKEASNYGGKESKGGSKNKEQMIKSDSIKKTEHFEKPALGNGYSQKLENTNSPKSQNLHSSNGNEYYYIPNTGNSSVGTELLKNLDSIKMDSYGQQSEVQKVILYQNPDMQAFQYDQQSQYWKQPQYPQQNQCMEQFQYTVYPKNTSCWCSIIPWCKFYLGYPTNPVLKQHGVHQQYVAKKDHKKSYTIVYEPNFIKRRVAHGRELFRLLEVCRTSSEYKIGFISVKYDWTETHLKLERGLNILATCKNDECALHMEGIVCPRGSFVDRNGYCTLDMELFKVICPRCKQNITPDESFGFGFYDCSFKLTYRLVSQQEHRTSVDGNSGLFYFGKFCPFREKFLFLEAQIAILSGLL